MRVWVRSEYAPELAVLLAWLAALIPWNVTFSELSGVGSVAFVRFPLFQIRYTFGISFTRAVTVMNPYSAFRFQQRGGATLADAYAVWIAGAAAVVLALLLSAALYAAEPRVTAALGAPVLGMGALLLLAGVAHAAATVLLYTRGPPGLPIPVGVVFQVAFGAVLIAAERV